MDRSYRDKTSDRIDAKATETEIATKLDTATVGVYLGGCVSTAAANGALTVFTFTHLGGGVTDIINGTEVVIADGVQQERTTDYTFVSATATVNFEAASTPTAGNVYLNGCKLATW